VGVLQDLDADVMCLQELTKGYVDQSQENTWEYIAHRLGVEYQSQEIPIITAESQWLQANVIFSKYPIRTTLAQWLHEPKNPRDLGDQYRGYLEVGIDRGGTTYTIATTHMSFDQKSDHDHELDQLLALVRHRRERYILTGDLNATPDSYRIQELLRYVQNAGPPFDQNTWTTKPFSFPDGRHVASLDWRYDYVLVSPDVYVAAAHTVATDVSDHLPILVTIDLS
jgi:endonuclease/exonuclease/phosphatase family metal-dependent hydrolase